MNKESREIPEQRSQGSEPQAIGNKLVGYAVVYDSPSELIQEQGKAFVEVILPGAFDASLASGRSAIENRPITFVFRHNDYAEFGSTEDGLTLAADEKGIRFELVLPEYAMHLRDAVATGKVRDMSFEFYCLKDRWDGNCRYVESGDLVHISAVPRGAYPDANVELRQKNDNWLLKNILLRKKLGMRTK